MNYATGSILILSYLLCASEDQCPAFSISPASEPVIAADVAAPFLKECK